MQALRQWIVSTRLKPGARMPSERSLARDLGIRHYALNRAMAALVAEREVERRGQKLYYSPQNTRTESFTCDVVAPARSVYIQGYRRVARELGIDLRLHAWQSMDQGVHTLLAMDTPETQSVIFEPAFSAPAAHWEPALERLAAHSIPVVVVSQPSNVACSILGDYAHALRLAVEHFLAQGHTELALICPAAKSPEGAEMVAAWRPLCEQYGFDTSSARVFQCDMARFLHEDVEELVADLTASASNITGIAIYSENESSIPGLIRGLAERRRLVPRNISLISLRDSLVLRNSVPPITATALDMTVLQESAFRMAQRAARKKEEPRSAAAAAPPRVRVQPQLIVRGSTASRLLVGGTQGPHSNVHASASAQAAGAASTAPMLMHQLLERDPFALTPRRSAEELEAALRGAYPLCRWAEESRFVQVDLNPFTNRPLNYRRGWLGDLPLKQLSAGKHMIHGVPFQVLGGTTRAEGGAVVFHSAINTTGHARELPSRLTIPVNTDDVLAIYVLHGCGYAKACRHFATYRFLRGRKEIAEVPLISYGQGQTQPVGEHGAAKSHNGNSIGSVGTIGSMGSEAAPPVKAPALQPNIQDWWPDFPHMDFPGARMAPIMESRPEDSTFQHVFLYTLEWVNPQPGTRVSHLEVTVDPTQSTTLGMLAVTVLRKSSGEAETGETKRKGDREQENSIAT